MEQPSDVGADGAAAVTPGMPEQRHQPHLGVERQADCPEVEPAFWDIVVEDHSRLVGDVTADVRHVGPSAQRPSDGLVFTGMQVDPGIGESGRPPQ